MATTWAAIGYYALIATACAYLLYYRVLAMAGAGNLMLVTLLIPPVAITLGAWCATRFWRRKPIWVSRCWPWPFGHRRAPFPDPAEGANRAEITGNRHALSFWCRISCRPSQTRALLWHVGLGQDSICPTCCASGDWFHYSIDYRIGTRYMGEYIADNAKAHAMQVPFLRELLLSDLIYIGSNISFENLSPVSTYLGKPGDAAKGGLEMSEYRRRQSQFRQAEISALMDTSYFIERAERLYGYPNFICDTGGSICEWVDPGDPDDPVLHALSESCLMVWLKGSEDHSQELIRRFDRDPKPMAYRADFLKTRGRSIGRKPNLRQSRPRRFYPLDLRQGAGT